MVGQTQQAAQKRKATGTTDTVWDEEAIFADLEARCSAAEVAVARKIADWMKSSGDRIVFGRGKKDGSMTAGFVRPDGKEIYPAMLYAYGRVAIQFQWMKDRPFFSDLGHRRELIARLNAIKGLAISEDKISMRPSILLSVLAPSPEGVMQLIDALAWAVSEFRLA